jgi:predicted TIM-barrel fold metal-dependent hydrolase
MAHLTSCGLRGVLEIADLPNVVIDTSAFLPVAGLVEYAVKHLGEDRVLYGSDLVIRDLPSQIGRVTSADITDAAKEKILYSNGAALIGLA